MNRYFNLTRDGIALGRTLESIPAQGYALVRKIARDGGVTVTLVPRYEFCGQSCVDLFTEISPDTTRTEILHTLRFDPQTGRLNVVRQVNTPARGYNIIYSLAEWSARQNVTVEMSVLDVAGNSYGGEVFDKAIETKNFLR
jgi:hypothetical protein